MNAGRRARAWRTGFTLAGVLFWLAYIAAFPVAIDAHAYFAAQLGHLYGGTLGGPDAYLYSPAFAQAFEPLRWLGWDAFRSVFRLAELAVLVWFTGPFVGLFLFVPPVFVEIGAGNIHLLLAVVAVAGFRFPALWSFVLLTKVTPGIGLLWFAVRREWRSLAIAFGTTVAIVAVSFVTMPGAWFDWIDTLLHPGATSHAVALDLPLWLRLAGAGALVVWGASTERRWVMPIAMFVALPAAWITALSMLVALLGQNARVRVVRAPIDHVVLAEPGLPDGGAVGLR